MTSYKDRSTGQEFEFDSDQCLCKHKTLGQGACFASALLACDRPQFLERDLQVAVILSHMVHPFHPKDIQSIRPQSSGLWKG